MDSLIGEYVLRVGFHNWEAAFLFDSVQWMDCVWCVIVVMICRRSLWLVTYDPVAMK